jgi:hypothetical protein
MSIKRILCHYRITETYNTLEAYENAKDIAYLDSDCSFSNSEHYYIFYKDDKTFTLTFFISSIKVEDKFDDMFYVETVEEKYKNLIRNEVMEQTIDSLDVEYDGTVNPDYNCINDYKSIKLEFDHIAITTLKLLPNPWYDDIHNSSVVYNSDTYTG